MSTQPEQRKKTPKKPVKETPEWQKNIAIGTNTAGAIAGPAALAMAVQQARTKQGGIPRRTTEFAERKTSSATRTGRLARKTGRVLRNPKMIAAGGATAIGLQTANWAGDTIAARALTQQKRKDKMDMSKSIEQSVVSKAETNPVTGHGVNLETVEKRLIDDKMWREASGKKTREAAVQGGIAGSVLGGTVGGAATHALKTNKKTKALAIGAGAASTSAAGAAVSLRSHKKFYADPRVRAAAEKRTLNSLAAKGKKNVRVEKRYYDSEADRQRRLGAASGVLGGVAVVTGAEAARRVPLKGVGRAVRAGIKGNPRVAAGLAAASGLSGLGAAASYKRGISRRNMTWQ